MGVYHPEVMLLLRPTAPLGLDRLVIIYTFSGVAGSGATAAKSDPENRALRRHSRG